MTWTWVKRIVAIAVIVSLPTIFVAQNSANIDARHHDNLVQQCRLWDGIHRILSTGPSEPLKVPTDIGAADPATLRVAAEILNQEHARSEKQQAAADKALGKRPPC